MCRLLCREVLSNRWGLRTATDARSVADVPSVNNTAIMRVRPHGLTSNSRPDRIDEVDVDHRTGVVDADQRKPSENERVLLQLLHPFVGRDIAEVHAVNVSPEVDVQMHALLVCHCASTRVATKEQELCLFAHNSPLPFGG